MKKKKEFFRIRKDRKRKNGANARACVRIHRQDSPRPFAAFQITTDDREKSRWPFLSQKTNRPTEKPLFSFLNITDRVLFSKLVRVSEPTLFCFLNLPANRKARPSPKPLRVRVCTYTARRRHQKTAEKGAVALFKPYKAATSHFTGAIDRFYARHLFVSYRRVYGRGRERGYTPHTPPRYQREWQGVHFNPTYIANIAQGA